MSVLCTRLVAQKQMPTKLKRTFLDGNQARLTLPYTNLNKITLVQTFASLGKVCPFHP